jgi:hypothetical protein
LHEDVCERRLSAGAETLWDVFESLGEEHGWSAAPVAWSLRGWIAQFGGAGNVNRALSASQHRHQLHSGEALDWWRVEHLDRPHLLRLRADIPLPGRLWLELSVHDRGDGRCSYRQRCVFQPYGLAGEAFWAASSPFRFAVLGGIARAITSAARQRPASRAVSGEVAAGTPGR